MGNDEDWKHKSLCELKKCFPDKLNKEEYFALLHILFDFYSNRNLAELISDFTGNDYYTTLNDVYGIECFVQLNADTVNRMKKAIMQNNSQYLIIDEY